MQHTDKLFAEETRQHRERPKERAAPSNHSQLFGIASAYVFLRI
jgi:hypothetical protein